MTEREKIHSGQLYLPTDPEILAEQARYQDKMQQYNALAHTQPEKRAAMLKELFAEVGEGTCIETPFYANWGGHHVHFGNNVFANFGLTLVDDTHIYVGDNTMFGPNVVLATAGHPIDPELRRKGLQYNLPIHIGKNCWLGAGVLVMPGITIGDNTVVGAGSVVTRDIPAGVVAVGNPCRVLRPVGERDREYYCRDRKISADFFEK